MAFFFDNPSELSLEKVNNNSWPCDNRDRYLIFHPSIIVEKLPPNATFTSKDALATVLIELSRSMHYLWTEYDEEIDDPIALLRQYIQKIYTGYGEEEMRWAVHMAGLAAPSVDRMLDFAADGIGSWVC